MGVQRAEGLLGHPDPVVGGPSGDDRVEPRDQRVRVRPSQGLCFRGQASPDPSQRLFARLGQQLAVGIAADAEPEEVEPLAEVNDPRLGLVERKAPGFQPPGKPRLDLLGLRAGGAQDGQIVGVSHQNRGTGNGTQGAALPVPDSGGLLHAVQCHVHERGADHAALGSSLPGQGDPAVLQHACPQPPADQFPGGERSQRAEDVLMAEPVECRLQVSVEYPQPPGILAGCRGVDGHDRIMAAPARPESIGLRLEPGLPLRFQRVDCQGLQPPVSDHGNSEPATAPVALRHIHPPDRQGPPRGRAALQPVGHIGLLPARQHDAPVDPGRLAASVDLRHPPHAHQSVTAGTEHQLLQVPDPGKVPGLRCREGPPPQTPYMLFGPAPVHTVPAQAIVLRSVHQIGVQLVPRFGRLDVISPQAHQTRVSALSSRATALSGQLCENRWRRSQHSVPVSCCLSATGIRFSGLPAPAGGFRLPHGRPTGSKHLPDPIGVVTFRMR